MGKAKVSRKLPSMTEVLGQLRESELPRPYRVTVAREVLDQFRRGRTKATLPEVVSRIEKELQRLSRARLQPVINATGVLIHTNLGRAPLNPRILEKVVACAAGYNNLEFELVTGARGHRGEYLERGLATLCGAESATVVNNCAAALVLV